MQSGNDAFAARACNIQCVLHLRCPLSNTIEKPSYLTNNTVSFKIVQLLESMNNRFTAVFSSVHTRWR